MSSVHRPPNQLLQRLPAADFEALRPHLKLIEMARDAVLTETGAALNQVYIPHAGVVSIVVGLSEGQMVAAALVGRDTIVGSAELLGDGISLSDAVVLSPGAASTIDLTDFRTIAAQSAVFRNLLARHQQAVFLQAQQTAACNASHSVEARLARWLLLAHDLSDGRMLPMTQGLLARMIGVQRNAISIVASALQQGGIISYSRGQIEVTNMEALRRTACECYAAIKTRHEQLLGEPD
ncbi:Crp/Fnr family transcriptional regulator [Bradyrhizobium sp.]|uniref:Crp/Fnr family transcriptional regulator n=1 Tax=Bradyrhizobium sp. TaxID=376 RepID=UPI003C4EB485